MSEHHEGVGLLWALAGFCTLSIGDAVVKGMAGMWSPLAMAATRYCAGTIGLGILLGMREGWPAVRLPRQGMQWVRGVAISSSAVGMFLAVWLMPLAEATARISVILLVIRKLPGSLTWPSTVKFRLSASSMFTATCGSLTKRPRSRWSIIAASSTRPASSSAAISTSSSCSWRSDAFFLLHPDRRHLRSRTSYAARKAGWSTSAGIGGSEASAPR